jgi:hypothetical protein
MKKAESLLLEVEVEALQLHQEKADLLQAAAKVKDKDLELVEVIQPMLEVLEVELPHLKVKEVQPKVKDLDKVVHQIKVESSQSVEVEVDQPQ